jgi:hypothetical protein
MSNVRELPTGTVTFLSSEFEAGASLSRDEAVDAALALD